MKNYTKVYDGLKEETNDLISSEIISYLLRRAQYENTTKPIIEQTHLQKQVLTTKPTLQKKIKELESNGYFVKKAIFNRSGNSTQFQLKDKALKYIDNSISDDEEIENNSSFDLPIETATNKQVHGEIEISKQIAPTIKEESTEQKQTISIENDMETKTIISSPKPSIETMLKELENKDNLDFEFEAQTETNKAINPTETANNEEAETIDFAAIQATKINYYENATDNNNSNIKNLLDAVQQSPTNEDKYNKIKYLQGSASMMSQERKQEYKRQNLPLVSVSVQFDPTAKTRSKNSIKKFNNIIAIDIDQADNNLSMESIKELVKQFPFVFYLAQSVSGKGLFALVYIDGTIEDFQPHYFSLENYFKERGITIDKACKDATRLRYCTIDKHYYINPNAVIYKGKEYQANSNEIKNNKNFNTKQTFSEYQTIYNCKVDEEAEKKLNTIIEDCRNSNIIINPTHKETLLISKAIANDLGESGFNYLLQFAELKHGNNTDIEKYKNLFYNDLNTKTDLHLPSVYRLYKEAKGIEKIKW
jgi:DNA-binding MarR family transcriptional regulator